ncbi:MAG: class I SAM-dependent methyltransferase [Acidimicrobiales bacterium]
MTRWADTPGAATGDAYDARFRALADAGHHVHGEADLVASYGPRCVLDAGCGTGRVAIELARRGSEVLGVDVDPRMLDTARANAPTLRWVLGDLATGLASEGPLSGELGALRFDVVVAAGNVLIFVAPGTEAAVVATCAGALAPGGRFVTGFQLNPGGYGLGGPEGLDAHARAAGLVLEDRWGTWERAPYTGGDYAVSVFRAG